MVKRKQRLESTHWFPDQHESLSKKTRENSTQGWPLASTCTQVCIHRQAHTHTHTYTHCKPQDCFLPIASSNANRTVFPWSPSCWALFPIHLKPVNVSYTDNTKERRSVLGLEEEAQLVECLPCPQYNPCYHIHWVWCYVPRIPAIRRCRRRIRRSRSSLATYDAQGQPGLYETPSQNIKGKEEECR